jgi:transposase
MNTADIIGSNGLTSTAINTLQMKAYADTLGRRSDVAELRITRAANGLIVAIDNGYNGVSETFIAANLKEATEIITAQLASKLLEQS